MPVAAGGSYDTVALIVGYALSDKLGQQVVIDNRPGAAGNIGACRCTARWTDRPLRIRSEITLWEKAVKVSGAKVE